MAYGKPTVSCTMSRVQDRDTRYHTLTIAEHCPQISCSYRIYIVLPFVPHGSPSDRTSPAMSETQRTVHQPIHPDIAGRLDPEYAKFHNANSAYLVPLHLQSWDPAVRQKPAILGGSDPLEVGDVNDLSLGKYAIRVFTPETSAPVPGWPVLLYFRGGACTLSNELNGCLLPRTGGWTLGNISTQNAFCTHMCKRTSPVHMPHTYQWQMSYYIQAQAAL